MPATDQGGPRTAPAPFPPAQLLGRVVRYQGDEREPGLRMGYVRRAAARTVTVQSASSADAATLSARYRGKRRRVPLERVAGFYFRGRFLALDFGGGRS